MLLHHTIALDVLRKTLPPIDEDQRLALLHAPSKGTTLFGGELVKLQEAKTKQAATFTVFLTPIAPPVSYSSHPYVRRGKNLDFSDRRGSRSSSGWGRGQSRFMPTATITEPGQSKKGQTTMTVSVPQDSDKRKVEPRDDASKTPRKNKRHFQGRGQGKKQ